MENSDNSRKKQLRNEFIRSGAVLLLALILLIGAVLAWFGDYQGASIGPFLLAIQSPEGAIDLGNDVTLERNIVIPAATKVDDDSISAEDLSLVIKVEKYTIYAREALSLYVKVEPHEDVEGLHYYIDAEEDDDTDTELTYATAIKNATVKPDSEANVTLTDNDAQETVIGSATYTYKREIYIIYWADYDTHQATIRGDDKQVELPVDVEFGLVSE